MTVGSRLPLSCSGPMVNSSQETGSSLARSAASIVSMNGRTVLPNRHQHRNIARAARFWVLAFLVVLWIAGPARVQPAVVVALPRITLIVFADRHMPDAEWAALFDDLRQGYANLALESRFVPATIDLIRGDALQPGAYFDAPVSIYLHGDCTLLAQPEQSVPQGALGWVLRNHGRIEPFIHVDCTRIRDMLGQYALGMNHDRRNVAMAEAIARVVLHEWVHVATQSAAHQREGISKRSFGIADLIPDYLPPQAQVRHGH